jgi:ferredoxin-nitrite reductase
VADAIVRVFIDHGDRTNRAKARLKYLLESMGIEAFVAEVEKRLDLALARIPDDLVKVRPAPNRLAHIGVHRQKQKGLNWIGVATPTGHMSADQMDALAASAAAFGDGDIRLTVWQNLILSGVADEHVDAAKAALAAHGLKTDVSPIRAGLVACTGNIGCKFAHADTKGAAEQIAAHVESKLKMDQPVNIHITGCPHSCAQHYVGDIGLVACKVDVGEDSEPVEGFSVVVGGGAGPDARLARDYQASVPADRCPALIERLFGAYLKHREGACETFLAFANRHEIEDLCALAGEVAR